MAHLKNILSKLKLFDVSLRDGLQSIPKIYELHEKKRMLSKIIHQYRPHQMEIGSIVSYNVLPQMKNSIELYKYATDKYATDKYATNKYATNKYTTNKYDNKISLTPKYDFINDDLYELDDNIKCDFFLLVPPIKSYIERASINNIKNISLITSVSESFQKKNIHRSIIDTKRALNDSLSHENQFTNIKLYISCITNCPIEGNINNDYIINEIIYYSKLKNVTNLCLSDTCGNMEFIDFKYIIDNLLLNINIDILSLHLHVNKNNYINIEKIIDYAISNKIYKFDVTGFENVGGCIVTIDQNKLHGNLQYKDLLNTMQKYTIVP
jgi:isopropylmalate/homocitrate/citramalate synthase